MYPLLSLFRIVPFPLRFFTAFLFQQRPLFVPEPFYSAWAPKEHHVANHLTWFHDRPPFRPWWGWWHNGESPGTMEYWETGNNLQLFGANTQMRSNQLSDCADCSDCPLSIFFSSFEPCFGRKKCVQIEMKSSACIASQMRQRERESGGVAAGIFLPLVFLFFLIF